MTANDLIKPGHVGKIANMARFLRNGTIGSVEAIVIG